MGHITRAFHVYSTLVYLELVHGYLCENSAEGANATAGNKLDKRAEVCMHGFTLYRYVDIYICRYVYMSTYAIDTHVRLFVGSQIIDHAFD